MSTVGPGTRLLCIQASGLPGDVLVVGATYTCLEVLPLTETTWCALHCFSCSYDGVRVTELAPLYSEHDAHCLGCFRPLDGDLPASLTRFLDEPLKPKVLEPA